MTRPLVNRYKQLLAAIPDGEFYKADGQVLPLRNSPYEMRITTNYPNQEYSIFLNGMFNGYLTTDAFGLALFSLSLVKGSNEIKIVNNANQEYSISYITARDYATWLAGIADVIESIDAGIEQVLDDSRLETASATLIDKVFGATVELSNASGYDLEAYRDLLQEVRQAYRYYGATKKGVSDVVRAFTQISPLIYPKSFAPRWELGSDVLYPRTNTNITLWSSNALYIPATIESVSANSALSGTLHYSKTSIGSPATLTWASPPATGQPVTITGNGSYTLYTGDYVNPILSYRTTLGYVINSNNNILRVSLDDGPVVDIALTIGTVSAATLMSDINSALSLSAYGVATVAQAYDPYLTGDNIVAMTVPSPYKSITLHFADGSYDAGQTIFNLPYIRSGLTSNHLAGVTTLALNSIINIDMWPDIASGDWIDATIGGGVYQPPALSPSAAAITSQESIRIIAIDKTLRTLTLASPTTYSHQSGEIVYINHSYTRGLEPKRSITVNVPDVSLLPQPVSTTAGLGITFNNTNPDTIVRGTGSFIADGFLPGFNVNVTGSTFNNGTYVIASVSATTITLTAAAVLTPETSTAAVLSQSSMDQPIVIGGTGVPDGWIATTSTFTPATPVDSPFGSYFQLTRDLPFTITSNSILTIPIPDSVLQYKGYPYTFEVWAKIDDISRPLPYTDISALSVSYDGVTFISSFIAPTLPADPAENRPTRYYTTGIIPETATKLVVRVQTDTNAGLMSIHKVRFVMPYNTALYLGSGTTPRNESQIKAGQNIYTWNSEKPADLTEWTTISAQIDKILPDNIWVNKFDVSEYDAFNNPVNMVGVFNDTEFLAGATTNTSVVIYSPPKFSHLIPSLVSEREETVQFTTISPYVATLSVDSTQNLLKSVLFVDGVPLTQDEWSYISANQISLVSPPSTTSVYIFRYEALIQYQSAVLDLGTNYLNYLWFADYHVFTRPEISPTKSTITTGLQFDSNARAVLPDRSDGNKNTATLIQDFGLNIRRTIPQSKWDFINTNIIQLSQSEFDPNAFYELTYTSEVSIPGSNVGVVVELRDSLLSANVSTATYRQIVQNQPVTVNRYFQMRVSLTGIRDVRDSRIMSLCLKGLPLFGSGTIPVLKP